MVSPPRTQRGVLRLRRGDNKPRALWKHGVLCVASSYGNCIGKNRHNLSRPLSQDAFTSFTLSPLRKTFLPPRNLSLTLSPLPSVVLVSFFTYPWLKGKGSQRLLRSRTRSLTTSKPQACLQPQSRTLLWTPANLPQTSRSKCTGEIDPPSVGREEFTSIFPSNVDALRSLSPLLTTQQTDPRRYLHFHHWAKSNAVQCAHFGIQGNFRASRLQDDKRQIRGTDQKRSHTRGCRACSLRAVG